MKERILVSACLLGVNCKYNGQNNENQEVLDFIKDKEVIIVCPEILGGLTTPRKPAEIVADKVINIDGNDVTSNYIRGAEETLKLAKLFGVKKALLKSKSPSCGHHLVYDGTFTNTLTTKDGITTKLLKENNIEVITEKDIKKVNFS